MLVLAGLLAGCQPGVPGTNGAGDVTPNAVTGAAIEVTALDTPPPAAAEALTSAAAAPQPAAPPTVTPTPDAAPLAGSTAAAAPPADPTEAATPSEPADAAAAEAAEPVPPPPPKSDRQIACERKQGSWEDTGGGLMICIQPTRDGGKRCTRESQCESLCLARSGTCAPIKPLLGCHDILQDDGSRATQCVE
jgi:hypothetical protein